MSDIVRLGFNMSDDTNPSVTKLEPAQTDTKTDTETNDSKALRQKLIYRDQIYDRSTRQTRLVKSAPKQKQSKRYSRCVLLIRRIYSERMVYVGTEVDVKGKLLLGELKELHKDTHGVSLGEGQDTVSPEMLYWSMERLEKLLTHLKSDNGSEEARERTIFELESAKQFVEDEFGSVANQLKVLLHEGKITFQTLWTILPPSTLIYSKDEFGQDRVYRLQESSVTRGRDGSDARVLSVVYTESDGTRLGIASSTLVIPQFQGAVSITNLPAYPVKFHSDGLRLWEALLTRGKHQLCFHGNGHHLREYRGFALKEGTQRVEKFNTHGRMIVDAATFEELRPSNSMIPDLETALPKPSKRFPVQDPFGHMEPPTKIPDAEEEETSSEDSYYLPVDMPDSAIIMLSGRLYGFSLGDSEWGTFAVSQISEVKWSEAMFESLVMPPRSKELLYALVKAHGTSSSGFDDVVKDKGKGLVGLLLGPPGVGKTLTAEAVAETAQLPLFMMSCGSLGSSAREINKSLQGYLELATRWNAVLLLDEADVYLAKRNDNDLERNAIISVFLREIEYYTGILILTTNRAQDIDSAFQSRIHFCHHYHSHEFEARKNIWSSFIQRSRSNDKIRVDIGEDGLSKLAALDFNGRQIKNAMSIAVTLAASNQDNNTLRADDIIDVSQLLQDFDFQNENGQDKVGTVERLDKGETMFVDLIDI